MYEDYNEEVAHRQGDWNRSRDVERMSCNSENEDEDIDYNDHGLSMTPEDANKICSDADTVSARVLVTLKQFVELKFINRYFSQFGNIKAISSAPKSPFCFVQFEDEDAAKVCIDYTGENGAIKIQGVDGFARPAKVNSPQQPEPEKKKRMYYEEASEFGHGIALTPEEAKEICSDENTVSARVLVTLKQFVELEFIIRYFNQFGHIKAILCEPNSPFCIVQFEDEDTAKVCIDYTGENGAIKIQGVDGFARLAKANTHQEAEPEKWNKPKVEAAGTSNYVYKFKQYSANLTDESTQHNRIYIDYSSLRLREIEEYLEPYGVITGIQRSPHDRNNPRAAIVQFEDVSSANKVLENTTISFKNEEIMVRPWKVSDIKDIKKVHDHDARLKQRQKYFSDPETANCRIYVGNIKDDTITEKQLMKYFRVYGHIRSCIFYKKGNGYTYAFVGFMYEEGVAKCLENGPGYRLILGQILNVSAIKPPLQRVPGGSYGGYPSTQGSFSGYPGTGGSYGGYPGTGGSYGGYPGTGVTSRMGNGDINLRDSQSTRFNSNLARSHFSDYAPVTHSFNPPGMGVSTPMNTGQSNSESMEMFQDPRGMYEITRVLDPRRYNDVEIIVMNESLRNYAEYIESILLSVKLKVDIIFRPPGMPTSKIISDLIKRNCLFALMVNRENEMWETLTVHVLQGNIQTHMNIPVLDAMGIVEENFFKHIQSTLPNLMRNQGSRRQGGKIAKDVKHVRNTRNSIEITTSPKFLSEGSSSSKAKNGADKQDTRPQGVRDEGHWRGFLPQGRGRRIEERLGGLLHTPF